jgi:hypothetical protein
MGSIACLAAALCIATGIACGQSTPSQAIINFSVDSTNCSFNDPIQGTIFNSGTIFITINNSETEAAIYQCETVGTAYDYIQNLANKINQNSPWVTANVLSDGSSGVSGGSLHLTSKTTGTSVNYPLSVTATYDSTDFTGPAYVSSAPTIMTGGATSRNFALAVFGDASDLGPDEDIAWFSAGSNLSQTGGNDLQPVGGAILGVVSFLPNPNQPVGPNNLPQYNLPQQDAQGNRYDYNRVEAIYVDEPYAAVLTSLPWTNPCHDSRYQDVIVPLSRQLQALAQAIRQRARSSMDDGYHLRCESLHGDPEQFFD